jgi:hypothetical protein
VVISYWKNEKLIRGILFCKSSFMPILEIRAEAVSRYGSGTTKMMRLFAAPDLHATLFCG